MDLAVVAAILGHSTVVLTATVYANVLDRTKREGLATLGDLLDRSAVPTFPVLDVAQDDDGSVPPR